ncbi:hypothetical protein N9Z01_07765 [Flavobacteriaceae bacterium]|nr:hypothetical protein [Flavobacteriaceae bacterium]
MKKGLLSLLAVALTVVSCQNYDDQFESLTDQITELSTTVAGLTTITDQVTALQQTVNGLATASALTALAGVVNDNATAIAAATAAATAAGSSADAATAAATAAGAGADAATAAVATVADQVASVQASITAILADLENVATAADLDTISATLAIVQADVKEILAGNAVINQDVTIKNAATLEYAQSLIGTEEDDPNVIINGQVLINTSSFTSTITADELASVNAIAAKIATILGDGPDSPAKKGLVVTSSTSLTFTNLTFIDDDYVINTSRPEDSALRTVSGDLITDFAGTHDFTNITSVDNIIINNDAGVTVLNLDGVTVNGSIDSGTLTLANATTINLGTAELTSLSANKATDIDSALDEFAAGLTINAPLADTIDFAAESIGGLLDLTTNTDTLVHFDSLETVAGITSTQAGAQFHIPALASTAGGALNVVADVVNASGLVTVTAANAADFNGSASVMLDALKDVKGVLTLDGMAVINLPNADVAGQVMSTLATDVTVKSVDDIVTNVPANTVDLTLTGHDADVIIAAANTLTDINITAASGSAIEFTDNNTAGLTNITLTDVATATFNGSAATNFVSTNLLFINIAGSASNLATATTSGDLIRFISAGGALAEWNNTANVKDDPAVLSGEEAVTIDIASSQLKEINLSTMEKVRVVRLPASNGALTSVVAPASTNLLTPGANPSFVIAFSNTVTYTEATLRKADGVNPVVEYGEAHLHAPGASTWAAYITAISVANPSPTFSLDWASVVAIGNDGTKKSATSITAAFAADLQNTDTDAVDGRTSDLNVDNDSPHVGVIDTAAELAIISATPKS